MKKQSRKYLVVAVVTLLLLVLTSCTKSGGKVDYKPISGWNGILDILVWPMAGLMWGIGKTIAFGNYGVTIVLTTIVVRSLAWPIYAKSNDMTLKMQLMAPEQAKLEAKYEGKTDPESNQRKQMEMMQLYKKYGVGVGGCLLPFVQFPIFIAFYETLQRVPVTRGAEYKLDFSFFKGNLLWIDLFQGRINPETGAIISSTQNWGVIVLSVLVGITQIVSQILMSRRQKKTKEESQSNVPEYRRTQPNDMQKQTENTMKFMMYGMTAMMVFFVLRSTAALGLYWLVGNIYSTLQGHLGHKKSKTRMEKLKAKM